MSTKNQQASGETFEITEPGTYMMRNGGKFVVKCVDWPGQYPIVGYPEHARIVIWSRTRNGKTRADEQTMEHDIVAKYEEPKVDLKSYVGKVVYYAGHKFNAARLVVWAGDDSVAMAADGEIEEYKRDDFLKQYKLAEDSK